MKYLLPSSNCSLCLPSGRRVQCTDAVIEPAKDDAELNAHLQDMVTVGNCVPFDDAAPLTPQQTPVKIGNNGVAK